MILFNKFFLTRRPSLVSVIEPPFHSRVKPLISVHSSTPNVVTLFSCLDQCIGDLKNKLHRKSLIIESQYFNHHHHHHHHHHHLYLHVSIVKVRSKYSCVHVVISYVNYHLSTVVRLRTALSQNQRHVATSCHLKYKENLLLILAKLCAMPGVINSSQYTNVNIAHFVLALLFKITAPMKFVTLKGNPYQPHKLSYSTTRSQFFLKWWLSSK